VLRASSGDYGYRVGAAGYRAGAAGHAFARMMIQAERRSRWMDRLSDEGEGYKGYVPRLQVSYHQSILLMYRSKPGTLDSAHRLAPSIA
jgi:hypothetical protein